MVPNTLMIAFCCLCARASQGKNTMNLDALNDVDRSAGSGSSSDLMFDSPPQHGSLPRSPVTLSALSTHRGITLSMSLDSVDDMYYGCRGKMLLKVHYQYIHKGLSSTLTYHCASKAMETKDRSDHLSLNHLKALCAYTSSSYYDLNSAMRKGKASFQFHAFHFLLTDAIQRLKLNQPGCWTAYRRSALFFTGEPGETFRFGFFASSSLRKDLFHFGRRTCFEIRTCFGAYLKAYSQFESEDEVLIPPYEMFTIVSVDRSGTNTLQCDVYYKVETAGLYSSLNCQATNIFY